MKLNFSGMAFLVAELTKREMFAIYLLEFDKEMPDQVTKADLVRIIHVRAVQEGGCEESSELQTDMHHSNPLQIVQQNNLQQDS